MTSLPSWRLLVYPEVNPVAVHRPGNIPLHLMKDVKEEPDRDVRIGA
jgi:hypothetical protein